FRPLRFKAVDPERAAGGGYRRGGAEAFKQAIILSARDQDRVALPAHFEHDAGIIVETRREAGIESDARLAQALQMAANSPQRRTEEKTVLVPQRLDLPQ